MIKAYNFRSWTPFCWTSKCLNLFHTAVMREAAPKINSWGNWEVFHFPTSHNIHNLFYPFFFSISVTTENIISQKNLSHKDKNSKKTHLYLLSQSPSYFLWYLLFRDAVFYVCLRFKTATASVNKPSFSSILRCSNIVGWESENHTLLASALTSLDVVYFYHAWAVLLVDKCRKIVRAVHSEPCSDSIWLQL